MLEKATSVVFALHTFFHHCLDLNEEFVGRTTLYTGPRGKHMIASNSYASSSIAGNLIEEEIGLFVVVPEADELLQMESDLGGRFKSVGITRASLLAAIERTIVIEHLKSDTTLNPVGVPLPIPILAMSQGEYFVIHHLRSAIEMLKGRVGRFTVLRFEHHT
ncbi:hypothetical protein [Paraburkholderia caribensis]|uniref:hypothetical protein n=1 Tax=Paraburkholderia caribensis TaxID=75105 RepID=UPI0034D32F54